MKTRALALILALFALPIFGVFAASASPLRPLGGSVFLSLVLAWALGACAWGLTVRLRPELVDLDGWQAHLLESLGAYLWLLIAFVMLAEGVAVAQSMAFGFLSAGTIAGNALAVRQLASGRKAVNDTDP